MCMMSLKTRVYLKRNCQIINVKQSSVLPSCHSSTADGSYSFRQMEADYKLLLVNAVLGGDT